MLTVDFDKFDLKPGLKVLDLGCGGGRHSFEMFRAGASVVALDYSANDLPSVRDMLFAMSAEGEAPSTASCLVARGDAMGLPFPDDSFDRVIVSEVLEHLADDMGALAEILRILKPGGKLAATVPAWLPEKVCWALSAEYHAPLSEGGHVRIYTEQLLRDRVAAAGLTPYDSSRTHALHSPYWWLRCLVGVGNDTHPLVKAYHDLLVWDMVSQPLPTQLFERLLSGPLGKSMVVYASAPSGSAPEAND